MTIELVDPATMLIKDMVFSNKIVGTRIINILMNNGNHTLEDVLRYTEGELLDLRNFGTVCLAELTVKLKRMGFELKQERKW